MFSFEKFKEVLADRFLTAYNKVLGFEDTSFHPLCFQLMCHDSIILALIQKYKNTLLIEKKVYNYSKYISDLRNM
jgi:hypothetical protein